MGIFSLLVYLIPLFLRIGHTLYLFWTTSLAQAIQETVVTMLGMIFAHCAVALGSIRYHTFWSGNLGRNCGDWVSGIKWPKENGTTIL